MNNLKQNITVMNETIYNYEILLREMAKDLLNLKKLIIDLQNEVLKNKNSINNIYSHLLKIKGLKYEDKKKGINEIRTGKL